MQCVLVVKQVQYPAGLIVVTHSAPENGCILFHFFSLSFCLPIGLSVCLSIFLSLTLSVSFPLPSMPKSGDRFLIFSRPSWYTTRLPIAYLSILRIRTTSPTYRSYWPFVFICMCVSVFVCFCVTCRAYFQDQGGLSLRSEQRREILCRPPVHLPFTTSTLVRVLVHTTLTTTFSNYKN